MATTKAKRILLVDSQPIVRERLTELIRATPDLCVCGEADDAAGALQLIQSANPDLVVLALALPDRHGLDLLKDIRLRHKKLPVLVFCFHPEEQYAERAIRSGAQGYLSKNQPTVEIVSAIRSVLDGKLHLSPRILARVARDHLTTGGRGGRNESFSCLSDRELQVFELLGSGLGCQAIAKRLTVSSKTIETYFERLKSKLGLTSIAYLRQAAIHAVRTGNLR